MASAREGPATTSDVSLSGPSAPPHNVHRIQIGYRRPQTASSSSTHFVQCAFVVRVLMGFYGPDVRVWFVSWLAGEHSCVLEC